MAIRVNERWKNGQMFLKSCAKYSWNARPTTIHARRGSDANAFQWVRRVGAGLTTLRD